MPQKQQPTRKPPKSSRYICGDQHKALSNAMSKSLIIERLIDTVRRGNHFRLFRYFVAGTAISLGYTFTIVALVDWLAFVTAEIANVISLILWTIVSYVIHREFTFRFDGEYGGSAARFIFVFTAKLIASIGCIAIITRYYQSSYLIGVIVNWVVLPMISYLALKLWVFQSVLKTSRIHLMSGLEG
jgi:putative flippase GtrA